MGRQTIRSAIRMVFWKYGLIVWSVDCWNAVPVPRRLGGNLNQREVNVLYHWAPVDNFEGLSSFLTHQLSRNSSSSGFLPSVRTRRIDALISHNQDYLTYEFSGFVCVQHSSSETSSSISKKETPISALLSSVSSTVNQPFDASPKSISQLLLTNPKKNLCQRFPPWLPSLSILESIFHSLSAHVSNHIEGGKAQSRILTPRSAQPLWYDVQVLRGDRWSA